MVKNFLLGNKDIFAIEYEFQDGSTGSGKIRLWLNSCYIGAYEDINILSVTLAQLENLALSESIENEGFVESSIEETYFYIKEGNDEGAGKYFLSLGEAFDDFSIVVYSFKGSFNFIWKLWDDPFFEYEGYPKGLLSASIPIDFFKQIVALFKSSIEDELSNRERLQ